MLALRVQILLHRRDFKVSSLIAASPMKGGDLDSFEMDSLEKMILYWEADNLRFEKKVPALKLIL